MFNKNIFLKILVLILALMMFSSFVAHQKFFNLSANSNDCIRCVRVGRGWYECRSGYSTGGIVCISEGALCQHDGPCR